MKPPTRVVAAGVDTWSVCWYLDGAEGDPATRALSALAIEPSARGSMFVPGTIAGHRVGWFPGARLAVAEGHPGPDGTLAPVATLGAAQRALERSLADVGIPVATCASKRGDRGQVEAGRGGVRRLDLTVDVEFESRRVGLVALEVLGKLDVARSKTNVWTDGGRHETVNLTGYGGRRIMGRVYDKGVEAGTARPGQLIRLEDQRRFQAGRRPDAEKLTPATVHPLFLARFGGIAQSQTVTLGGLDALVGALDEMVERGDLRPSTGEKLAGALVMQLRGQGPPVRSDERARRAYYRRRRQLRELGLVLLRSGDDRVDVKLGELFAAALGEQVWGELQDEARAA